MSRPAVALAVLKVGLKEAFAYRAELVVWILTTTMPLVMLALFAAVAREAPLGPYGEREFVAYFLATFIVRQVTGSWAAWQLNVDIKEGTLQARLLRPLHPLVAYALEHLASVPVRFALAVPAAALALGVFVGDLVTHSPLSWLVLLLAVFGGWLLTLFVNFAIGSLAFTLDSTTRVMDIYVALYIIFSGYLIPVDLFPGALRSVLTFLPFRYQISLPVEILTGRFDAAPGKLWQPLAIQWAWVATTFLLARASFRRGVARFGAFGG